MTLQVGCTPAQSPDPPKEVEGAVHRVLTGSPVQRIPKVPGKFPGLPSPLYKVRRLLYRQASRVEATSCGTWVAVGTEAGPAHAPRELRTAAGRRRHRLQAT